MSEKEEGGARNEGKGVFVYLYVEKYLPTRHQVLKQRTSAGWGSGLLESLTRGRQGVSNK